MDDISQKQIAQQYQDIVNNMLNNPLSILRDMPFPSVLSPPSSPPPPPPPPPPSISVLSSTAKELLIKRLNGITCHSWLSDKDFICCHATGINSDVLIFYCFDYDKNKSGVLWDDFNLFPSDELLTKLRLLRG